MKCVLSRASICKNSGKDRKITDRRERESEREGGGKERTGEFFLLIYTYINI
jgi:hypothetical protein